MVIECSNCHARYNVDASKIPSSGVKVKCHKCQNIIVIRKEPPKSEPVQAAPVLPSVPDVQPSVTPPTAPPEAPSMPEPEVPEPPPMPTMPSEEPEAPESQPAPQEPSFPETPSEGPAPVTTPSATVTPPVPEPPEPESPVDVSAGPAEPAVTAQEPPAPTAMSEEDKKWNERARRLAKALASDLVLYNQDKVEEGLRNGTLANLLGSEIRRSWEYYCQQIPKHIVESTDHFKDQLNKIVGKGKEIFK